MLVELYIRGRLHRGWLIESIVFYEPICQVTHDERKKLFALIIENCKKDMGSVVLTKPYEFFITVPARIQPADINPEEQEKFLQLLLENKPN